MPDLSEERLRQLLEYTRGREGFANNMVWAHELQTLTEEVLRLREEHAKLTKAAQDAVVELGMVARGVTPWVDRSEAMKVIKYLIEALGKV